MNTNTKEPLPYEQFVNVIGKYILTHPYWRRTFIDHQPSDVVNALLRHMKNDTIRIARDEQDEICGLLLFTPHKAEGLVEINHLLGNGPHIVNAAFAAWAKEYPDCEVRVQRRGKIRIFKPEVFLSSQ